MVVLMLILLLQLVLLFTLLLLLLVLLQLVLLVKMRMEKSGRLTYVIVNTNDDHVFHAHVLLLLMCCESCLWNESRLPVRVTINLTCPKYPCRPDLQNRLASGVGQGIMGIMGIPLVPAHHAVDLFRQQRT